MRFKLNATKDAIQMVVLTKTLSKRKSKLRIQQKRIINQAGLLKSLPSTINGETERIVLADRLSWKTLMNTNGKQF